MHVDIIFLFQILCKWQTVDNCVSKCGNMLIMENPITHRIRSQRNYWKIKKNPVLYKKYKIRVKQSVALWRKNNPLKIRAQRKVFVAVRNGSLKKKPCFCGQIKVEAHHADYSKPLQVQWLCKIHHVIADLKLRKS